MASNQAGRMKGLLNSSEAASLLLMGDESRDDDNSQDFNEGGLLKIRKRTVVKRFRKEWLDEPIFSAWLRPIASNPERCVCTICGVMLVAGHSELERHAAGKKHCSTMNAILDKSKTEVESFPEEETVKNEGVVYGNKLIIFQNNASDKKTCFPKGTILQRLSLKDKEKINRPIVMNQPRKLIKRKATLQGHRPTSQNLPENPDAKLIRMLKSDTEDDFDDEEELEDLDDTLPPSQVLLRELKAELKFQENKMIQDKQTEAEDNYNPQNRKIDEALSQEKELEARLNFIEEKRRHELNIYKLRLIEMESRVRLAEAEATRAEELHQLRTAHLQLLLQKEQASFIVEGSEIQTEPQYDVQ